jgi:uncharacterized RDD family membrane protein YckC
MKAINQIRILVGCLIGGVLLTSSATAQNTNIPPAGAESSLLTNSVSATNALAAAQSAADANDNEAADKVETQSSHNTQPIVLFGQNAELKAGENAEAVVVIGGSAKIHGHVRDAVVVIGGDLEVDGEVDDAVVAVFGNVHVQPGAVIHQDAVAVMGSVSLPPDFKLRGDAVAVMGSITAGKGAKIEGDTVAIGGKLDLADDVTVGGDKVNIGLPPPFNNFDWLGKWFRYCVLEFRPLAPQVGFVWIIAGVFFLFNLLIAAAFPRPVHYCVEDLNRRPATIFALGLLTKLLVPFLYLVLAATGVGLIVAPVIWVALLIFAIVGKVAVLEWIGFKLGGLFGGGIQKPLLAFLLGTVLITLLYLVPFLGLLTYLFLGVWGLGSGITAVFGRLRRETPETPAPPTAAPAAAAAASVGPMDAPPFVHDPMPPTPGNPASVESAAATGSIPAGAPQLQLGGSPPSVLPALASFPKASLFERTCAAFLDIILVSIVSGVAGLGPLFFLVALAYFAGMWTWRGTTVGGIVLKLKVIRTDGQPLTFVVALVRGLGAAFSVVIFFLGFLWIAWDKDKQGWHDKIAGTDVVRLPQSAPLVVL